VLSIYSHKRRSLVLKRRFIDPITFKKRTYSSHNDKWGTGEDTYTEYSIRGLITASFPDFEEYMPFGILPHTDIVMYTFPDFELDDGTTVTIEIEDRIVYDGVEYEIKKIHRQRHYNIKAIVCLCRMVTD